MIRLEDIGLAPTKPTVPPPARVEGPPAPEAGSVEARALWEIWRGRPVTVLSSPPGGGKSSLIVSLVQRMRRDAGLQITVAVPTVVAAEGLAERIAQRAGEGSVALSGSAFTRPVPGVRMAASASQRRQLAGEDLITVRTVASCKQAPPEVDVLVFDEAYQTTFGQAAAAASSAEQVLMVGDPGQIGPVIAPETRAWDRMRVAPHHRAPEAFARREDAIELHLPHTYRLGAATTAAIAPLYDFEFSSARPNLRIDGLDEIETVTVPASDRVADRVAMGAAADRALSMVGRELIHDGGRVALGEQDVCVIAARNEQIAMLRVLLRDRGLTQVQVGTADSLQGGQWAAVVAVDPFYGAPVGSAHSRSLGRLCVMASRHFGHLSWVCADDWRAVIRSADMTSHERSAHQRVRRAIAAGS